MIIPGKNPVIELLKSEWLVNEVLIQAGASDEKISEIIKLAEQKNIKVQEVAEKQLTKLYERHQGVVADANYIFEKLPKKEIPFGYYMFVREAQDLGNIGAIIRTAEAAGITGVILPANISPHPTMARTSMGAMFHLPIYQASLFPAIKQFRKGGFQIVAIEIDGEANLFSGDFTIPTLIIVGGEDYSVSHEVQSKCDTVFNIPQTGQVNSLNMSVASAIAIYEYVRQSG